MSRWSSLTYIAIQQEGWNVMPVDIFSNSPTYQKTVKPGVRQRRVSLIPHLSERYSPVEQRKLTIARLRSTKDPSEKGHSPERYYDDFTIYKGVHDKYLTASEDERIIIIALAETDHTKQERDGFLHAIWCLSHDGIRTMDDVMRLDAENAPADALAAKPLDRIIAAILDMAEAEQRIYSDIRDAVEEIADLKKRIAASDEENRSLKKKLGDCEQRLAEIEDLLTADPAKFAAMDTSAKRLKRDVIIGLPQHTRIGDHWKKIHSVVYRKGFNRFLRDKGLQPHEKDAIIEAVEQIMINPFAKSLETEVRWNGDNGETVAGMENREKYYYTHATHPYLRIRWIIRDGEGRVHFIDAFRKTTNQA